MVKVHKIGWQIAGVFAGLVVLASSGAATVDYGHDMLNRVVRANYNNGQQVIDYTYDDAGNILSRTIFIAEQISPLLTIDSPPDGAIVTDPYVTITGTATDAGRGDSGITSVTVDGVSCSGPPVSGGGVANWSCGKALAGEGTSTVSLVATDGSPFFNQTVQTLNLVYLPLPADSDGDGLPSVWESAHGTDPNTPDGHLDPDGDGYSTDAEYKAGTDPQQASSRPEGANSVNYVLFRDHFSDGRYDDRWYVSYRDVDPGNSTYSLLESGTKLQTMIQKPVQQCMGGRLSSFATMDTANAVYHARLRLAGSGTTSVGLMKGEDLNNRIELQVDADQAPYLSIRSWDAGVLTQAAAGADADLHGTDIDVRLVKIGAAYTLYVNNTYQGVMPNNGLGDATLRPYLWQQICADDPVLADSSVDLVELLLDRDGDGLADLHEDRNANGARDARESDPLDPDSDADTVRDGADNCTLVANTDQRDTNGDGYGNACDADLNGDLLVNTLDFGLFRQAFGSSGPALDADFNGDGIVNTLDFGRFRQMFGAPPGPSGVAP